VQKLCTIGINGFPLGWKPAGSGNVTPTGEIFFLPAPDRRFCLVIENLRKITRWRTCEKGPDRKGTAGEPVMSYFLDRHPTAGLWLIAALQGAAMLGLNVLLRVLVS
jgi:hypothetical protein